MNSTIETSIVNGLDTDALRGVIETVRQDPSHAATHWHVATHWRGGTRSDTKVTECTLGGQKVDKDFTIKIDEPLQLGGTNQFANPQEHLLASLNACMIVGYSVLCALEGIELTSLSIETEGEIDLRGFLGLSKEVKPGYDELRYAVHIKGNGTPEQFEKIHRAVMATSPNYFNVRNSIPLKSRLVVG